MPANYYVYSGATGTGSGLSWVNAFTTISAALNTASGGDNVWVAHDHAETQASAMTLDGSGGVGTVTRVICVNRAGSVPPVSADLRTTATVKTTGASNISFAHTAYYYGISFTAGDGSNTAKIISSSNGGLSLFDTCVLELGNTSTSSKIETGTGGNGGFTEMVNTQVKFANASQGIGLIAQLKWRNTASAILGTAPTTLFPAASSGWGGVFRFVGLDLSALGSGHNIITLSESDPGSVDFVDCKLGASVSLTTGTYSASDLDYIRFVNCDSADTNYQYYLSKYWGTIQHETTIIRNGGSSDGTTAFSRKMISNSNVSFAAPLRSDWSVVWNETTGSSVTVKIKTVTDNVTLKDNECWVEVEYLGTSGFPEGNFASDAAADPLNTGTNQTTSTDTWTTTGLTTPVKQELSVTFTPVKKGPMRVRVCLAKASTTVYFDPKPFIS